MGGWSGERTAVRRRSVRLGGLDFNQRWDLSAFLARFSGVHPLRRVLTLALLIGALATPLLAAASAYQDYRQLRTLGQDAITHLLAGKDALMPPTADSGATSGGSCVVAGTATPQPSSTKPQAGSKAPAASTGSAGSGSVSGLKVPDPQQLATAQREFATARSEFQQLAGLLDVPNPTLSIAGDVPSLRGTMSTVRQLVYIGDDAATVGYDLTVAATPLLTRLHNGALADSSQPLITAKEAAQLRGAIITSTTLLGDIQRHSGQVQPSQLPVSACQRAEFVKLTGEIGQARSILTQVPALFDMATWLVGVGQPRHFLIQTMDRAELRPTGGFTGDFGVLTLNGGRVSPFTLRDVNWVYNNTLGNAAPPVYSWWPFGNWGLRDANLSPDFPTTAHLEMGLYQRYVAHAIGQPTQVDGVVQLTVVPIAHILQITGPIRMADYGETVTAANVEERIHYYQNNFTAIAREDSICRVNNASKTATTRKCFTGELGKLLEDRVRHLSMSQLTQVVKSILGDMHAHEIQIYVTNPKIESYLLGLGYAGRLTTAPGQDSLMVDQANVSVSKASAYVKVRMSDDVTLDSTGGATHNFTMSINNDPSVDPTDAAYSSITTYRDYVRIYVPRQAQLMWANGFDTGKPVCWEPTLTDKPKTKPPKQFAKLPKCPTVMFGDGSLVCPKGNYAPGPNMTTGDGVEWPVDDTGFPTNDRSDVAGLTMFGGYVTVPENCTGTITLDWYVPHVAAPSSAVGAKSPAYTLHVERQAGTEIPAAVTIHPSGAVKSESHRSITYAGVLEADLMLTVPRPKS